jgi:hypothetical protein
MTFFDIISYCSFCLDAKRTKKVKAKANAPPLLPGQRTWDPDILKIVYWIVMKS